MRILYNYDAGPALRRRLGALATQGFEVTVCAEDDDAALFRALPGTDVLWHCLRRVDTAMMDAAPGLRLVQKIGVGVNTIDLEAARARGIAVCNLPGTNSSAVAEHTLLLMLAVLRRLRTFDMLTRTGRGWSRDAALEDGLGELGGRTVGFVGFGAVPRALAPALRALGAECVYTTPAPKDVDLLHLPLDDLLRRSDVVSLHVPLTADTEHLLSAERLRTMRPGAILVNTARGGLVDTSALLDALEAGHLSGAGLDVFEEEPLPVDHPLFTREDVVLAPHVAWLTQETLQRSVEVASENCRRLRTGEPLLHRIV